MQNCTSPAIPATVVEYLPAEVSCSGNTAETSVSHALQLGAFCGEIFGDVFNDYLFNDLIMECGPENQFWTVNDRFTCSSTASFPASSPGIGKTLQQVFMSTDTTWLQGLDISCFTVIESAPAPPVPTATPPVQTPTPPVAAPTAKPPVVAPTPKPPVRAPVKPPVKPPVAVPTAKPIVLAPTKPPVLAPAPMALPTTGRPVSTPVPAISPVLSPNTNSDAIYRASYVGQFQYIRDSFCIGPNPVVQAHCFGQIDVTGTSDPRIQCSSLAAGLGFEGWNGVQCQSNCTEDADCATIFLTKDSDFEDGPIGQVFFQCAGAALDDVNALFTYEASEGASCAPSSNLVTRNFHIASMGVSCPSDSGSAQEYIFDEFYFECFDGFAIALGASSDQLRCISGDNCDGVQCVIEPKRIIIGMDLPKFQDKCVDPPVPTTPAPTPASPPSTSSFVVSALFQAAWGLLFDESTGNVCSGSIPTVKITCLKGDIKFVNATYPATTNCSSTGPGVLECVDSSNTFVNQFSGVTYVSADGSSRKATSFVV